MKKNCKKHYKLFVKNNENYDCIRCDAKELLKNEPKLVITNNNSEIYKLDNIQSLYLYPLTVIDYINNIKNKNIIYTIIIEIDSNLDYIEIFNNKRFKYLKAVEISINKNYSETELIKIGEIIEYFYNKSVLVNLNIKNLINIPNFLAQKFKYVTYFKIFLPSDLTDNLYKDFLNKLLLIKQLKLNNSLVHIKTYLSIHKVLLYEKMINDFIKLNVDIFQVSKELLPIDHNNKKVDIKVQNLIRNLETKYNNYSCTKFISVKDLTTLYYPRFELDERNSRKCYSCYMKPYLFKDKLIPCKVNKIFNDFENWSSKYFDFNKYKNITNKCGAECDDCASMFENDLLYTVENILKNNETVDVYLIKE